MKALIISDTHRDIQNVIKILKVLMPKGIQTIIHCGDHVDDMRRLQGIYPELVIYSVHGNCDGMAYGDDLTRLIQLEEVPILITHGHRYGVKREDFEELIIDGQAHEAKLIVFGHSHCAYLAKKQEIILMNPGSISVPRDAIYPSYGIVEIVANTIKEVNIMQLLPGGGVGTHPVVYQTHYK